MAWRHPTVRSVLLGAAVVVGLGALVVLLYDPWYLNYDTRYALLWARDLIHGFTPAYTADFAPTPHPLWTAIAGLTLIGGDHAPQLMLGVVLIAFGALVYLVYLLGKEVANGWVGFVAALVVATRPAIGRDVMLGYLDVGFAALMVLAVLLEVKRPKRGLAVLVVLAFAGMLRPEAWVLGWLYVAWLWRGIERRERIRYVVIALLAPAVWFISDAIITGDALHSLHGTRDLADENDRRQGLRDVPYWTLQYFGFTLRLPILLGLPVGLWFAWRRGLDKAWIVLVVALLLVAGFAVSPIFGLPLIGRYIRTPAVLLTIFYGLACAGFTTLAPSPARFRWGLAALVCIGFSVAYGPSLIDKLDGLRGRRDRDSALYSGLHALAESPAVEAAFRRCPRISASDHRPIPFLRWWLHGAPDSVGTTENDLSPLAKIWVTPRPTKVPRSYYGDNFPKAGVPRGYVQIYRNHQWRAFAAPECA